MICKNCKEEMVLTYRYRAKEYYESDEEEYKCPCCEATVLLFEDCERWEGLEEEDGYDDGYLDEVGMRISDLIERR